SSPGTPTTCANCATGTRPSWPRPTTPVCRSTSVPTPAAGSRRAARPTGCCSCTPAPGCRRRPFWRRRRGARGSGWASPAWWRAGWRTWSCTRRIRAPTCAWWPRRAGSCCVAGWCAEGCPQGTARSRPPLHAGPMPVARELTFAPFRGSAAVAAGFVTRRQLDGLAWRRLYRDVYRRAGLDLDTLAWCYAAGLLLDDRGAVSGLSAAALWGADVCEPGAPVEMTVPPPVHLRPPPGLVIRRSPLDPADVSLRARTPVTSPVRTGYDIARCGNRVAAVVG